MMKRVYSLLLCGILLTAITSACSSASAPANPATETDQEMNDMDMNNMDEGSTTEPDATNPEDSDGDTTSSTTDDSAEATAPTTDATDSDTSTTHTGSVAEKGPIAADSVEKRPTYLPTDFPIPDDAVISTSHQEESDGKKSVLLIYTTKGSMETLSQTYKEYFDAKSLKDAGSTINATNLIIQGTDPKTKQVWSLIGSPKTDTDTVELTLTWSEQ